MIVCEPVPAQSNRGPDPRNLRHGTDDIIPHFRRITDEVKEAGAVVIQQIYHIGAHGDGDLSFQPHWSPSGGPSYHDSDGSHRMTVREIEELLDAHVAAAVRARACGFHGVEVWAAYHSLLDQFWTPWSNSRDDDWGGSLQNRTRFSPPADRTHAGRLRRGFRHRPCRQLFARLRGHHAVGRIPVRDHRPA